MKKWHPLAAVAAVASIPALATGCEPEPLGELVVVISTDMAPPKDFDQLRVEVFKEGALKVQFEGPIPGNPEDELRIVLPGTLGLLSPENPSDSVRIEVGVRSGANGPVRLVREVVTTVPPDRVAMLPVPLQFLCKKDNIPFNSDDKLQSECGEGLTCLAGSCVESKVEESTLQDYDAVKIFGGGRTAAKGTCFDVQTCFAAAELLDLAELDSATCTLPLPAGTTAEALNLALGVESDGICNSRGCFVVLDANSDTGWKIDEAGKIAMPKGICDNLQQQDKNSGLKVLQIVRQATGDGCPQKDFTYPTCGPWSAVAPSEPPPPVPISIAGAQDHPIAVSIVDFEGAPFAFWSNNGGNSLKAVSLAGGELEALSSDGTNGPRDLVATEKALFFTDADMNNQGAMYSYRFDGDKADALRELQPAQDHPDGIAVAGNKVFWTEFLKQGNVHAGTLSADLGSFSDVVILATAQDYPVRLVADAKFVYWTNESTDMDKNGSIARLDHTSGDPVPEKLSPDPLYAPRAVVLDYNADGSTKDLYFATIGDGKVWRIRDVASAAPGAPEVFAGDLLAPNGLAVDDKNVYIANRGNGTIVSKPKDAAVDEKVEVLASAQKNPGTIVVKGGFLVWVNEGPSGGETKEGSIVKYDISQLGQ